MATFNFAYDKYQLRLRKPPVGLPLRGAILELNGVKPCAP